MMLLSLLGATLGASCAAAFDGQAVPGGATVRDGGAARVLRNLSNQCTADREAWVRGVRTHKTNGVRL
jgi:hypothetical protein